ncbi:sortase A [Candidatus Electrothrix marina]|uniref:Sortase A n=2 Tax=Candidatus Electrothrix marina TaxID=1859130 RepID=A0A444JG05_9BACT|nr:sortase A [Candidatus Electrothrix marina]
MKINWSWKIILFPAIVGMLCFGNGLWIHGKGLLAQVLLQRAWAQTLIRGESVKPWPWADTWPVARLRTEKYNRDLIVLAGQSGQALAFGPGMLEAGGKPGQPGSCILAAHRDTHFSFLRRVQAGDVFTLEDRQGREWQYRVKTTEIRMAAELYLDTEATSQLALITCYPFQALSSGTGQRYVVLADRI